MFVRGCISDLRGATFQMHGPSGADPGLDAGDMKIVYGRYEDCIQRGASALVCCGVGVSVSIEGMLRNVYL